MGRRRAHQQEVLLVFEDERPIRSPSAAPLTRRLCRAKPLEPQRLGPFQGWPVSLLAQPPTKRLTHAQNTVVQCSHIVSPVYVDLLWRRRSTGSPRSFSDSFRETWAGVRSFERPNWHRIRTDTGKKRKPQRRSRLGAQPYLTDAIPPVTSKQVLLSLLP